MLEKIPEYFSLKHFQNNYLSAYQYNIEDQGVTFLEFHKLVQTKYLDFSRKILDIFHHQKFSVLVDTYFENENFRYYLKDTYNFKREEKISGGDFEKLLTQFIKEDFYIIGDTVIKNLIDIQRFIQNEIIKLTIQAKENKQINTPKKRGTLKDTEKLALAYVSGFIEILKTQNMPDDKINRIIGLFLDKDSKEFVYKNRLNIEAKEPYYQTDKYTAYQYIEPIKKYLDEL
ncbi:hypothetical protein [Chryseobacterium sp. CT-SW4]|uniref:hypothetical protein n=1 Tax=Chryseobacterium sp. SW-1 TaxID=3157343 RepID=UPI003B01C22B